MVRLVSFIMFVASMAALLPSGAQARGSAYERTYPPRMIAAAAQAISFYAEFRAREESGGLGHAYITLGTIGATGQMQETVVAGFMPKGADDDYWGRFGIPVTGLVGVVRSDFIRRPSDVRFRISISKIQYHRIVSTIHDLRKTWTTYNLLTQNCNSFVGEVASSAGLRTPMLAAQYPVNYVAELRALNSP